MNWPSRLIRRAFGVTNVLPLSERERSVEVERTMAKVRVGALVLYAGAATVKPGDDFRLTWAIFAVLCCGAVIGVRIARDESRVTTAKSVGVTLLDCVVFLSILRNNTSDPQDVVYIAGLLPTLEGALRWARRGGIVVAAAMGAAVAVWTVHITIVADLPLVAEQPLLRGGSIAVIGWAIGAIVANQRDQQVALQLALDSANDPVLTIDERGRVLSANEAASTVFWRSTDDLVGRRIIDLLGEDGTPAQLADLVGDADSTRTAEFELTTPVGESQWIEVQVIPIADLGISYARCRDITARFESTRRLAHMANHDPLTDLPNRRRLVSNLTELVRGSPGSTTLVYIDLDGFKSVNDSFGHDAGDELLCQVAARMQGCVRDGDLVARLAGDEFCVMIEGTDGPVVAAIDRLRAALREPFVVPGGSATIAASIGAVRHAPGEGPNELLRRADRAMYAAKSAGGDRVHPPDLRSAG